MADDLKRYLEVQVPVIAKAAGHLQRPQVDNGLSTADGIPVFGNALPVGDLRSAALLRGAGAAGLAMLLHGLVDNSYFVLDLAYATWIVFLLVELASENGTHLRSSAFSSSGLPWRR